MKTLESVLVLLILFIIAFSIYYYTDLSVMKVAESELSPPALNPPPAISKYDKLKNKLTDLEIEELFWKNRIRVAANDQFNLILNIPDSLLELDIKGISVHQSKIQYYEYSPEIKKKKEIFEAVGWLLKPSTLNGQWATISKRPIRIKDITNIKNLTDSLDYTPMPDDSGNVSMVLICSGDLSIGISQMVKSQSNNPVLTRSISQTSTDLLPAIVDSTRFRDLLKKDWIHLQIARLDIIAIYRALNEKSQLVVRL